MGGQVTVPYLRSEYGKDYDFDAPVKLLDAMMHEQALGKGQAVVVLGQVSQPLSPSVNHTCHLGLITCLPLFVRVSALPAHLVMNRDAW